MDQRNTKGTFFSLDPGTVLGTFFFAHAVRKTNIHTCMHVDGTVITERCRAEGPPGHEASHLGYQGC